jgi:hypothetical protein
MNGLLAFGLGLGQQLVPFVRRVAALQHLAVLVINPGEHDLLARCVIAEEEPLLLEEFRPQPVLVIVTQSGALVAVLRTGHVLRDDVEGQLDDCRQSFAGVLLGVSARVFLL